MAKRIKCAVWLAVDPDGDYGTGSTREQAIESYQNDIGGDLVLRVVCLTVDVPVPVDLEASVAVPDAAGETVSAEA